MARVIRVSTSGIVDGGPAEATEVKFQFESARVESALTVSQNATGTVGNHTYVIGAAPFLVILPASPTIGERVTVEAIGDGAVGVSSSAGVNVFQNDAQFAINVSGSVAGFQRSFTYLSQSEAGQHWMSYVLGGAAGTTGSYTF